MKKQDEIEELFSSSFEGFEKIPPMDLKTSIDEKIFNDENSPVKRRRGFFWFLTLILLPGLTLFFGLIDFNQIESSKPQHGKNETKLTGNVDHEDISIQKYNSGIKQRSVSQKQVLFGFKFLFHELNTNNVTSKYVSTNTYLKINSKSKNETVKKKTKSNTGIPASENSFRQRKFKRKSNLKMTNSYDYFSLPKFRKDKRKKSTDSNIKPSIDNTEFVAIDRNVKFAVIKDQPVQTPFKSGIEEESLMNLGIDSLADNTEKDADSTKKDPTVTPEPTNRGNSDSVKPSPWALSIYSGGTFGLSSLNNSVNDNYTIKEGIGFSANFDVNYAVSPKFSFSAGLDYNTRRDIFTKITPPGDSVFTGYTEIYIYQNPPNQDTIIDTIYFSNYAVYSTETQQEQVIQQTSFAIPVFFSWSFYTKGNWTMALNTGFRFSYVKQRIVSDELANFQPTFNNFGLRAMIRPEIVYSKNKFGIGLYLNTGYDLLQTIKWDAIKRNRLDLGAGLVFRYHL